MTWVGRQVFDQYGIARDDYSMGRQEVFDRYGVAGESYERDYRRAGDMRSDDRSAFDMRSSSWRNQEDANRYTHETDYRRSMDDRIAEDTGYARGTQEFEAARQRELQDRGVRQEDIERDYQRNLQLQNMGLDAMATIINAEGNAIASANEMLQAIADAKAAGTMGSANATAEGRQATMDQLMEALGFFTSLRDDERRRRRRRKPHGYDLRGSIAMRT